MAILIPLIIIAASLSLPLIVAAGERTLDRDIVPRPSFARRFSRRGRQQQPVEQPQPSPSETAESVAETLVDERPGAGNRSWSEASVRRVGRERRVDTGFSISSGETYVRGMTLEKVGLD